jgi:hypothetical protein
LGTGCGRDYDIGGNSNDDENHDGYAMPMVTMMIESNGRVAIHFSLSSISMSMSMSISMSMPMPMPMPMPMVLVFFDENTAVDNCCMPMLMVWKTIHRKMRREDGRASWCDVLS